ncbi:hypothetical protein L228DRAFT_247556 [Xylona heveae TC161]|uniref:Uncharacterized protein n=1 Tax=Xylona heveae (strain CBS 132557 / TC161) TaxID=1328760 RepID=A0A165H7N8_XYLHT|nr:hypothetical protein L228DRAFT_247556 [Xylona heveae TC161]KZF23101.1 hypothetical protein L228DRAFT_247556 [Xylona heveae TC161]
MYTTLVSREIVNQNLHWEDPVELVIMQAYLGTVAVPVDQMNPNWGSGMKSNRPINNHQVKELSTLFMDTGLRKTTVENRLSAGCTADDFARMVGSPPPEVLEKHKMGGYRFGAELSYFPTGNATGQDIALYAGQHRRAADHLDTVQPQEPF